MPDVLHDIRPPLATITLNDPARRNALNMNMFDELDAALDQLAVRDDVHVLLLTGAGDAFSAGFDLGASIENTELPGRLIRRLSGTCRRLRRLPQIVVAAVRGPAIAGGCALLTACDFAFVAPDAKIGYPVHRIGLSPAVSAPTLIQAIGAGPARTLQLGGELLDGRRAAAIGLAWRCCDDADRVMDDALAHCRQLAEHGPHALRVTKDWLNRLDGSLDDTRFDPVAEHTARAAGSAQTQALLRAFWLSRR